MPISHFWIPPISSHPSPPLALLLQQSQHPCRVQVKSLISALYPIFSRFPKDSAPKAFLSLHRPSIRFISLLSSLQPSNSSFHSCPFQQLHVHYGTSPWPRSTCRHQIQCHLSLFLASRWPLRAGWHLPPPPPLSASGKPPRPVSPGSPACPPARSPERPLPNLSASVQSRSRHWPPHSCLLTFSCWGWGRALSWFMALHTKSLLMTHKLTSLSS